MSSSSSSSRSNFSAAQLCLLCTNQVQVEVQVETDFDFDPKSPNPGSSSSSSEQTQQAKSKSAKVISHEQGSFVLFQRVLRDLDLPNKYTQIRSRSKSSKCKNDDDHGSQSQQSQIIKYCESCLSQMTRIHELLQELARLERELAEQEAEIVLKFSKVTATTTNSTPTFTGGGGLTESESQRQAQEFLELRNAISAGLKLLKPRSILAIVEKNLRKRKARKRSTLQVVQPAKKYIDNHFRERFDKSNSKNSAKGAVRAARLMKNVSIRRHELRIGADRNDLAVVVATSAASSNSSSKCPTPDLPKTFENSESLPLKGDDDPLGVDCLDLGLENIAVPVPSCSSDSDMILDEKFLPDLELRVKLELELDEPSFPQMGITYVCGVCGAIFGDHDSLKHHDDEEHRNHSNRAIIDEFELPPLGGSAFPPPRPRSRSLAVHSSSSTSTEEKKFKCPQCPATFAQSTSVKRHLKLHTGEKPFKCPTCPRTFGRRDRLKTHLNSVVGAACSGQRFPKKYACPEPECSGKFTQKSTLNRHLLLHRGEKPFQCPSCSKSFTYRHYLQAHFKTREGALCSPRSILGADPLGGSDALRFRNDADPEQGTTTTKTMTDFPQVGIRFICKVCGEIFGDQDSLKEHEHDQSSHRQGHGSTTSTNANLPPGESDENESAPQDQPTVTVPVPAPIPPGGPKKLRRRVRRRPIGPIRCIPCPICEKPFATSWKLSRHLNQVHSGEKKYECLLCPKRFGRSYQLMRHVRLSHAEEKPGCSSEPEFGPSSGSIPVPVPVLIQISDAASGLILEQKLVPEFGLQDQDQDEFG